ncbi:MAG: Dabb family protein, partial [Clostridia bacterium]|nr:Dabb family protein [Clostridia bacterium]
MKQGLEALAGIVPGLIEMQVEISPLASSNADVMLYSVLESEDALKAYAVHPAHVEVANTLVRPYTATRACMDFEVK